MNQRYLSLVSALLLAGSFAATAQQLQPNELPTNIPGVTTIAAPPEWFNPLEATDQELEYHGYPPRPDQFQQPKAFATWQKAMGSSKERIAPVLEVTNNVAGPAKLTARAETASASGSAATSPNWSGYVNTNGSTSYGSSSFHYIVGEYVVPVARQAYGKCASTWDYAITWVGIDGWSSSDVLQAEAKPTHLVPPEKRRLTTRRGMSGTPITGLALQASPLFQATTSSLKSGTRLPLPAMPIS